ncbi:hypothetical protein M758_1G311800 [Ceratodon purpureus]|nr:hypothetical protein M758_1G311800 [Ceratodon purpureus]
MGNANPKFAHLRNCVINVFCNDMTAPANNQTVKSDQLRAGGMAQSFSSHHDRTSSSSNFQQIEIIKTVLLRNSRQLIIITFLMMILIEAPHQHFKLYTQSHEVNSKRLK